MVALQQPGISSPLFRRVSIGKFWICRASLTCIYLPGCAGSIDYGGFLPFEFVYHLFMLHPLICVKTNYHIRVLINLKYLHLSHNNYYIIQVAALATLALLLAAIGGADISLQYI